MSKKTVTAILVLIALIIVIALLVRKPAPLSAPVTQDQITANEEASTVPASPADTASATPSATSTPSTETPHIVKLDGVSPVSGKIGTSVTLKGSGFTKNNKVLFNSSLAVQNVNLVYSANGQQAITFIVPSSLTANCKANEACPAHAQIVTPGSYQISIENEGGKSNTLQFDVLK